MGDYDDAPDTEVTVMNRFSTLCVELTYDKLRSTTIEGVNLNTLSFVSGDNESTYSVAPGIATVVGRSCHSKTTTMYQNTQNGNDPRRGSIDAKTENEGGSDESR